MMGSGHLRRAVNNESRAGSADREHSRQPVGKAPLICRAKFTGKSYTPFKARRRRREQTKKKKKKRVTCSAAVHQGRYQLLEHFFHQHPFNRGKGQRARGKDRQQRARFAGGLFSKQFSPLRASAVVRFPASSFVGIARNVLAQNKKTDAM